MERRQVMALVEELAPLRYACSWDNCGLQVGDPGGEVSGVLVSVNPSGAAVDHAVARGHNLLITHHPLIFKALERLSSDRDPGKTAGNLLVHDITAYAAHTNLDATACNHQLADLLGWKLDRVLEPGGSENSSEQWGLGLYGTLLEPMTIGEIARRVRKAISPRSLRLVGDADRIVSRVGLCSGSGGDLAHTAADRGVELFITGEIRYHTALEIRSRHMAILEVGHQASEEPVVDFLVGYLARRLPATVPVEAFHELEPFEVLP